ncbi:allantoate permease [Coprinopsis cinerea okayama7|uniref:Allantoate permease n=1 Tax=Coprinopsis cinerea (strain Okayama-7 / 130 / ATCC MYA-4618 / FGSC 9003) TaxID=240176 RepID=A8P5S8_COPC7|nr:allantoate permease [Coprinopsis cinerea okayama7\|eukprot:XP_001839014.1 allantoate permease [Coprinopsis cinerea okayama7\
MATPAIEQKTTASHDVQASEQPAESRATKASSKSSSLSDLSDKKGDVVVDEKAYSRDDLVDEEPVPFQWVNWFFRRPYKPIDPNAIATRRSVYDDPILAPHYWPKPTYENYHRIDIDARWTNKEEQELVRKIDWKVMLWDFNLGNTVFRLAFLSAELPSQIISKRLGPDVWIPIQMCGWSIVTMVQFWLNGRTSFLVCRALLGLLQGGFIPDLILYLSYFYTKNELPIRLSLFWMSMHVCSILASFIAFGVLRMRGILGKEGWRWLFLIEGGITLLIGIATFFKMPPGITQTKTWFRPKGWFTDRQEVIAVTRILRDDPTKGDMHNREALTLKLLWKAFLDYDLWPLYIIGILFGIPASPPATYLTLSLRNLGFSTFQSNLLTIPSTFATIVTMYILAVISETVHNRAYVAMIEDVWVLPFLIALRALPDDPNPWLFYGLATGLLSYPYTHPIQVGWCSRNAGGVASRTVNASLYNMFVQASGIISANIYRQDDAPNYRRGNTVLITICAFNCFILYPGVKYYYVWRNKKRDEIWDKMTSEEKANYLATTKDTGNRRLDFRFAH